MVFVTDRRFKVVEACSITQPHPKSNLKNMSKRRTGFKNEKCPFKNWDLLHKRIYNSVKHLRWRFFWKIVNGLYPLTIFTEKLHYSCLTEFLKLEHKLEALSETITKIHDLKKAYAGWIKEASAPIIRNIDRVISSTWLHWCRML